MVSRHKESDQNTEGWERFSDGSRTQLFLGVRAHASWAMGVPEGYFNTNHFFLQLIRTHNN